MKKFIISFLFLIAFSISIYSQDILNISGEITNIENGDPVTNHEVFFNLNDSLGFYVTLTDQNGYYEEDIIINGMNATSVQIYTFDCNFMMHDTVVYDLGFPITADFEICDDPAGGDCQANFFYIPDSTDITTIHFRDMSFNPNGSIDSWSWDFGDGGISNEQNPSHTYNAAGIYPVCLTIEDTQGNCEDTFCMDVIVGEIPVDCNNYFEAETNNFYTYTFTGEVNVNDFTTYEWDFGDGTYGTDQQVTHTYDTIGGIAFYIACLTTTSIDSIGDTCVAVSCQDIFVGNQNPGCEAMYWYRPDSGSMYTYQFMDISIGNPTSWLWEFGDGTISTEQNPIHTYDDYGTYYVCLTIENDSCTDTFCDSIYVMNWPGGDCFSWFDSETNSLTVDFEAFTFSPYPTTYIWDFGDESDSLTGQSVTHTYEEAGTYPVTLQSIDSTGCTSETIQYIWVGNVQYNIWGTVYAGNNFADLGNVYLMTFDTLGNNLISIDTSSIDSSGTYQFQNVGINNWQIYFIQAELSDQSVYFEDYVPTYHYSAINWEEAIPVFPFPNGMGYDVDLVPVSSYAPGNGMINGTVHAENTRGTLHNVEMVLFNENNDALKYMRTNQEGSFDFNDLSLGTYMIHTEMIGVHAEPVWLTLTEENPEAEISIVVKDDMATLSINEKPLPVIEASGDIYPNPVNEEANIEITLRESTDITYSVVNNTGQQVICKNHSGLEGDNIINFITTQLQDGIYSLIIRTEEGAAIVRKFVKL